MTRLASIIWYGSFHHADDVHRPHLLPILGWTLFLLLLVTLRLNLPFMETPALEIHRETLRSLVAGQIWGRQALVSSLEYPPLPTLALLFSQTIARLTQLPPGHMLVAIAQVWGLFYLLRIPRSWTARAATAATLVVILALNQEARQIFYRVDPNWVVIIPAACALYHFVIWCRWCSLRDLVLLGINSGLLVFGGAAGIITASMLLAVASGRIRRWQRARPASATPEQLQANGSRLLLWAPAIYAFLLLFLANWLIMQNGFFFLQRPIYALQSVKLGTVLRSTLQNVAGMSWLALGALALFLLRMENKRHRLMALSLGSTLATLIVAVSLLHAFRLYTPGADALLLLLSLCGVLAPLWNLSREKHFPWRFSIELVILTLVILAGGAVPRPGIQSLALDMAKAPYRQAVLNAVDRHTPETRIMTYGYRTPAHYADIQEKRFLPRVDFQIATLRWRAESEDFFYILLPPNNGTFYAAKSEMADIHVQGRPWLILEKAWAGGWQLWRVLNPQRLDN